MRNRLRIVNGMNPSEYTKGTRVVILPEWRDRPEIETVFVVVGEDEGKGRVDIVPENWNRDRDGWIRPTETVRTNMIRRLS